MAMFNSYVKLPEGIPWIEISFLIMGMASLQYPAKKRSFTH